MTRIEVAGVHDIPGAYRVCLATGDAGRDATAMFRDTDLLGHVYVGPYLARGVDMQLVVVDERGVAGYLLTAFDTTDFERWAESAWWPALRDRYAPLDDGSADAALIRLIHEPERSPAEVVAAHPAHLHIDLLERARGQGLGRQLIDRLLGELRRAGVAGVHLGVDPSNANGIAFYRHLGFREVVRDPRGLFMGMTLG
jgi:ribosomal protein S18 acetylase RimI-like enzyme